jgi:hypothetical protein
VNAGLNVPANGLCFSGCCCMPTLLYGGIGPIGYSSIKLLKWGDVSCIQCHSFLLPRPLKKTSIKKIEGFRFASTNFVLFRMNS